MVPRIPRTWAVAAAVAAAVVLLPARGSASFHLMQIEQVIGGVGGDVTQQAIQLRMRFAGQNIVSQARLRAWNAAGASPVTILTIPGDVANFAAGSRVLIASAAFAAHGPSPDFTMTALIPPSYLAAGKLTFEETATGNVYWAVAWGGASYTGTNTGITVGGGGNEDDGNFNPPFGSALPSASTTALRFSGAIGDPSTTNSAQYAVTPGAATFTNNAGATGTVPVTLIDIAVE